MPEYKGRIFGRSVQDVRFRAFYGEDLFLGELLVGADLEHGRRYLFRITDVAYGSESSDDGWAERTAGGLMSMDQAGERTDLRDLERRLYKVAKVSSLGYVGADGRFHKPKSLPAQFGEVTAPAFDDLTFLRAQMGDVEVGRLRSGEDAIDLPVGIRGETLPSHVGVFATTGMGKSNLMKVLAGQLLAAHGRYAMLLFDPHGEYLEGGEAGRRGLAHHPWAAERLRVYSPNARAGQASLLRLSLAELTPDDLKTAWRFSGAQSEALESAAALLGDKGVWLRRLADEEPEDLKDAELGRHALATIQVPSRRAQRIVRLPLMTDHPSQSLTGKVLDDLAGGKVVLVDTSGLEAVEETLVASLLTRSLLDERAALYRNDRERFGRWPRTLVALEEAQRVLTRLEDAEFNVFPRLAREGRKFNVGMCAVSQQPKLIDPELLSQFNTYFVLGLADARLGRSHYQAVDEHGLNQREADFTADWHRAVEAALGLDPDAVLVLGDLFDAPRPTYRAFREGAKGLRRLAEAGVPTCAISGNHDTPRLRESGSPYAVLADSFPGLRFAYRGCWEPVDLLPGLRVHAVPQCTDEQALKEQIDAAARGRAADHLNLLVTHAAVTVLARRYTYGDVNELEVDLATLDAGFDRILLGHFHNFARVAPNAWYPGSTDTFTFKDLPQDGEPAVKGVLTLDTGSGKVAHHPVPGGRPLRSYRLDAFDLSAPQVYEAAAGLAGPEETAGAVVRLFVNRARPEVRRLVDRRQVAEVFAGALVVTVHVEAAEEEQAARLAAQPVVSLADEWDRYLANVPIEGYDRDRLAGMGRAF